MKKPANRAVYPGTFDPFTYGHEDIVRRAWQLFGHVTVAVAAQSTLKKTLFSVTERIDMAKKVLADNPEIKVVGFNGLLVNFMEQSGITVIIRGLRVISDFEYEFQMAHMNRCLCKKHETLFLVPSEKNQFISSTSVREVSALGGCVEKFVAPYVADKLREKFAPPTT